MNLALHSSDPFPFWTAVPTVSMKLTIAVVGAGVIGLSTALHIKERFSEAVEVTIIADKFSPATSSDKSSAVLKPTDFYNGPDQASSSAGSRDEYQENVGRWFQETMKKFHSIHNSEINSDVQLSLLTHYHLQQNVVPDPWWKDLVYGFRHVDVKSSEASLFTLPPGVKDVWSYTTYSLNPTSYLQWMQKHFLSKGGIMEKRSINSLQEISAEFDVVINCTGVWASHLLEDNMQPARGQSVLVKAPWITHCIHYDSGPKLTYIIPRADGVCLGGSLEHGNWSEKIEEDTTKSILDRCAQIEPSLRNADVIRVWAGLRPLRSHVRLDKSVSAGGKPLVIHCYGHGGQGMGLSWGCAMDIGDIVQREAIKNIS